MLSGACAPEIFPIFDQMSKPGAKPSEKQAPPWYADPAGFTLQKKFAALARTERSHQ